MQNKAAKIRDGKKKKKKTLLHSFNMDFKKQKERYFVEFYPQLLYLRVMKRASRLAARSALKSPTKHCAIFCVSHDPDIKAEVKS